MDASLFKHIPFGDGRGLELRIEAVNLLNHVNLGNPNTTLGTGSFGRILSAGAARTMQFGLKLSF